MGILDRKAAVAKSKLSRNRRGLQHVDRQVGARLREIRIRKGMSQSELGKTLGLTFQQIQKYEKGENAIASARMPALCDALGITPLDLYGDYFTKDRGIQTPIPQLRSSTIQAAIALEQLPSKVRATVMRLIADLTGEDLSISQTPVKAGKKPHE